MLWRISWAFPVRLSSGESYRKNTTDGKSTLAQVIAWCYETKGHYLIQWWPTSMRSCDITWLKWVKFKQQNDVWCGLWFNMCYSSMFKQCFKLLQIKVTCRQNIERVIMWNNWNINANKSASLLSIIRVWLIGSSTWWSHDKLSALPAPWSGYPVVTSGFPGQKVNDVKIQWLLYN